MFTRICIGFRKASFLFSLASPDFPICLRRLRCVVKSKFVGKGSTTYMSPNTQTHTHKSMREWENMWAQNSILIESKCARFTFFFLFMASNKFSPLHADRCDRKSEEKFYDGEFSFCQFFCIIHGFVVYTIWWVMCWSLIWQGLQKKKVV